jgi:hypothetical protein
VAAEWWSGIESPVRIFALSKPPQRLAACKGGGNGSVGEDKDGRQRINEPEEIRIYGFWAKIQPWLFMHCAKASSVIPLLRGLSEVSEYCTSLMRISRHVRKSCSNSPSPASGFAQYKFGAQAERHTEKRLMPIKVP